jgi:AcrR family transcriptional regulator
MVTQAERRSASIASILAAARKLFASDGFGTTTIDDIAARAGLAKGAVYHHFGSKEEIFERVLDGILGEIAEDVRRTAATGSGLVDAMVKGTQEYLECATMPEVRRILLIDGPAVLGWNKWREMDQAHFGRPLEGSLQAAEAGVSRADMEALYHLLTGAVMEAAFVCATARNPKKKARELGRGLRLLLSGLPLGKR